FPSASTSSPPAAPTPRGPTGRARPAQRSAGRPPALLNTHRLRGRRFGPFQMVGGQRRPAPLCNRGRDRLHHRLPRLDIQARQAMVQAVPPPVAQRSGPPLATHHLEGAEAPAPQAVGVEQGRGPAG
ncbi:hypothetical protein DI494_22245, partial [Stenotrophomonas maltophilia]